MITIDLIEFAQRNNFKMSDNGAWLEINQYPIQIQENNMGNLLFSILVEDTSHLAFLEIEEILKYNYQELQLELIEVGSIRLLSPSAKTIDEKKMWQTLNIITSNIQSNKCSPSIRHISNYKAISEAEVFHYKQIDRAVKWRGVIGLLLFVSSEGCRRFTKITPESEIKNLYLFGALFLALILAALSFFYFRNKNMLIRYLFSNEGFFKKNHLPMITMWFLGIYSLSYFFYELTKYFAPLNSP